MTIRLDRRSPFVGAVVSFLICIPLFNVVTLVLFGKAGDLPTAVLAGLVVAVYQYVRIHRDRRKAEAPHVF